MPSFVYSACGLRFASDFPFLELPAAVGDPDVHIRCSPVPEHLDSPLLIGAMFEASRGRFLLSIDGIARYEARGGSEILVDRVAGGNDDAMRGFLLGSVVAALLHQRGVMPLHAAAMATGAGAVVIAGHSGCGKSTLLAEFVRRGYAMIADDLTPIVLDVVSGRPMVQPGFPQFRLWADSAKLLGHDVSQLTRYRPQLEKYVVKAPASFMSQPQPLSAIYILHRDHAPEVSLEPYHGAARAVAVREHTFGRRVVAGLGLEAQHFGLATRVAGSVRVVDVRRPKHPFLLEPLADAIERDFSR